MAGDIEIPVGFANCALVWRRDSDLQPFYVTFGVSTENTATVASDVALAAAFAFPAGSMSSHMHLDKALARVAVEGGEPLFQEASIAINGTGSADLTSQNCTILYRKVTAHGGRAGRGRMYMPNLSEADVSDTGALTTAAITAENTRASNFFNGLADTTHGAATPMVLLHRPNKQGVTPQPFDVTSLFCDPVIATQRRRLRR